MSPMITVRHGPTGTKTDARTAATKDAPCVQEEGVSQEDVPGGAGCLDDVLAGGREESSAGRARQLRS